MNFCTFFERHLALPLMEKVQNRKRVKIIHKKESEILYRSERNMEHRLEVVANHHFESNESIEASRVTDAASDDDAPAPFPAFCFVERSPTWEGFHVASWPSSPSLEWDWMKRKSLIIW